MLAEFLKLFKTFSNDKTSFKSSFNFQKWDQPSFLFNHEEWMNEWICIYVCIWTVCMWMTKDVLNAFRKLKHTSIYIMIDLYWILCMLFLFWTGIFRFLKAFKMWWVSDWMNVGWLNLQFFLIFKFALIWTFNLKF